MAISISGSATTCHSPCRPRSSDDREARQGTSPSTATTKRHWNCDGRCPTSFRIICFVVRQMKYFLGIKFAVQGFENLNTEGPYMVVANHQSILDILGLLEVFPDHCVILAKKEVMYMGPVGFVCWLSKFIFIDRSNKRSARDAMDDVARTLLQQNLRVWVYPEGTRNRTATMLPFKRGVFSVAVKAQVPIIPVVTSYYQQPPNLKDGQRPFFCRAAQEK
ncbi:proline-rich protein 29 isoform X3 [Zootoca vivipara]|uniref:proline-rich protein 29 isoform X3 n=1 Tax=Zootoca vivipara TaxID=8524 RepID=UPI00293C0234|nr:proline-rich protein 29 isoform X3 [Zootoca vivipara]